MKKSQIEIGKRFHWLITLEELPSDETAHAMTLCECACGKRVAVRSMQLLNGNSKSCGCYSKKQIKYNPKRKIIPF